MIRSYLRDGPWLFHHQLLLNQAQWQLVVEAASPLIRSSDPRGAKRAADGEVPHGPPPPLPRLGKHGRVQGARWAEGAMAEERNKRSC